MEGIGMNPNSTKLRARIDAARKLGHDRKAGKIKVDPMSERQVKAVEMGYAYEEALGRYRHRPTLQYFKLGEDGFRSRTITFLYKAAVMADKAAAEYTDWVESQFYWFHKWFRRPPRIQELSGQSGKFPAPKRYLEYAKLALAGKAKAPTSDKMPTEPIARDVLDKINQERLQQLCSAWGYSETEIMIHFGKSGIFDAAWLKTNTLYQQLKKEGKLR